MNKPEPQRVERDQSDPPRVEKITYDGQIAWRKSPEKGRSNTFTWLHRLLALILPKSLTPTHSKGGIEGLMAELNRLKDFAALGLPVPALLDEGPTHFTLADAGQDLRAYLRGLEDHEAQGRLIHSAVLVLAQIHNAHRAHGRPHLKDMILRSDDKIFVLDLEEDPTSVMDLKEAQARDIWLLFGSCVEFFETPLDGLEPLLVAYRKAADQKLDGELAKLGRSLRPYRRFIKLCRGQNISKDVRGAYWATRLCEDLSA